MGKYYSKTTGGFYDPSIHSKMPPDAIPIMDTVYNALLGAQKTGRTIGADSKGNPIAVLPPAPTPAQLWAAYQAKAQAALTKSDMVAIRCVKAGVVFHDKWLAYVQALRAIVAAPSGDPAQPLPAQPPYPAGT